MAYDHVLQRFISGESGAAVLSSTSTTLRHGLNPARQADTSVQMARSSKAAVDFIDNLCGLARRLATKDLVVSQLHCDWRSFGSWTFEVQRGPAADAYADGCFDAATMQTAPMSCDSIGMSRKN